MCTFNYDASNCNEPVISCFYFCKSKKNNYFCIQIKSILTRDFFDISNSNSFLATLSRFVCRQKSLLIHLRNLV